MIKPARFALEADRWTPFVTTIEFEGLDLTGATFEAHVRLLPDTPGTPLIDLDTVTTASAEGVRLIGYADDVSSVGIRINESTMEAVGAQAQEGRELGTNAKLYWDLHITPSGGVKQVYAGGEFIVRAGVTQ